MQIPRFWTGEAAEGYDLGAIMKEFAGAFVAWHYYCYEDGGKAQSVNVPRMIYAPNVIHGASRALV